MSERKLKYEKKNDHENKKGTPTKIYNQESKRPTMLHYTTMRTVLASYWHDTRVMALFHRWKFDTWEQFCKIK